jgi:hypothetical protein
MRNNKSNFYNDESIDFDKSIIEENDFYVDDEAQHKENVRIERMSKQNNNLLISNPSIKF